MSILIKGMEMPICRTCPCCEEKLYGNLCHITNEIVPFSFDRGDKCPLVEVPPHGRLIDADAFDERIRIGNWLEDEDLPDDFRDGIHTTLVMLKTQRTIIESEE